MEDQIMNNQELPVNGTGGGNKKILIIFLIVVVLILIGLLGFWGWKSQRAKQEPKVNENMNVPVVVDQQAIEKEKEAVEKAGAIGRLFLQPENLQVKAGEQFTVSVMFDTNNYNISAAGAVLQYDSEKLEAIKIDGGDSVLTISAEETKALGKVTITRGKPGDSQWRDSDDGYTGNGALLTKVIFKAKSIGLTEIKFDSIESKLVLDDGRGTAMKMEYTIGQYEVQ